MRRLPAPNARSHPAKQTLEKGLGWRGRSLLSAGRITALVCLCRKQLRFGKTASPFVIQLGREPKRRMIARSQKLRPSLVPFFAFRIRNGDACHPDLCEQAEDIDHTLLGSTCIDAHRNLQLVFQVKSFLFPGLVTLVFFRGAKTTGKTSHPQWSGDATMDCKACFTPKTQLHETPIRAVQPQMD